MRFQLPSLITILGAVSLATRVQACLTWEIQVSTDSSSNECMYVHVNDDGVDIVNANVCADPNYVYTTWTFLTVDVSRYGVEIDAVVSSNDIRTWTQALTLYYHTDHGDWNWDASIPSSS